MTHKLCLMLGVGLSVLAGSNQNRPGNPTPGQGPKPAEVKQARAEEVTVKEIKHAQFLEELKAFKGKVVLVDFWSTSCVPCKEKFPKVVKLYKEHRDDGLVCVSAGLFTDKDAGMAFLKKVESVQPNFLVTDDENAQEHWDFTGIPAYYVIGRNGAVLMNGRFSDSFMEKVKYEDAEKVVLEELARK